MFPATIVDIPEEIEDEYRGVWAILDEIHHDSRVVGYDARGQPYDWTDPRVFGPSPTTDERLEAIRQHADDSMRYYATALIREPTEHRKLLGEQLASSAYFMALLEADAIAPRVVLARRSKIMEHYMQDAKEDPWRPADPS